MKILIIRNYPNFMDVVRNTYNIQEVGLAKALVRRGNDCDIIFWTDKEEKEVEIVVDENKKVCVYYRHGMTALKNTVYMGCDELFNKYDILQTAEYNQMQSWLLAKKYPNKVVIYHGPYYSDFNKRYNLMCSVFDCVFLKRYLKLNTQFITKSDMAKKFLVNKGVEESNIAALGVGIDVQLLSSCENVCYEPLYLKMKQDDKIKILYVGRFEERRNIPFVLKVFKEVLQRKANATLYLIGTGDKGYLDDFWKMVNELGLEEFIIYQEKMEQKYLSYVYSLADFFLLPTKYEIFGMVLLEAMYYETIVITTENGGSSTLIDNNINGYIRDDKDECEWAELIIQTISCESEIRKIKSEARKVIENNFIWDNLAQKFEKKYKNIISGGNN